METALSTISEMPSGKTEVAMFVRSIKAEILSNKSNPLPILVKLKYAEKTIAEILKDDDIDNHFLSEFLLYNKNEKVEINGAILRSGEVGTKYDYKASGDPQWIDLDKQITELTEKRKQREKFLQALDENGTVDPGTGLFVNRPPKSSHTKVLVTIR